MREIIMPKIKAARTFREVFLFLAVTDLKQR
jgi:hypothetical protein